MTYFDFGRQNLALNARAFSTTLLEKQMRPPARAIRSDGRCRSAVG